MQDLIAVPQFWAEFLPERRLDISGDGTRVEQPYARATPLICAGAIRSSAMLPALAPPQADDDVRDGAAAHLGMASAVEVWHQARRVVRVSAGRMK
jgi:hypothetical protein